MTPPLTRWAHWPQRTESSYYAMFYDALRPHGVVAVGDFEPTLEWLASTDADVVHIHWPEALWRRDGKTMVRRASHVWRLHRVLAAARRRGLKVVWTLHNLSAHEQSDWIDARGYAVIARHADLVICHSEWSAAQVRLAYGPRGAIVIMPHGNFEGFQPAPRSQAAIAADWDLDPSRPLLTCLGYLREYKGLELVCDALRQLDRDIALIIGGPPFRKYDLSPLRDRVAALPHARLLERRLTDQEFADLTAASDVALLPYLKVTSSSGLMGAWSQGTGVIVSDLPFFGETTQSAGEAAARFRSGDSTALAATIDAYLSIPRARRQAAARQQADLFSWDRCVTPVVEWMRVHP